MSNKITKAQLEANNKELKDIIIILQQENLKLRQANTCLKNSQTQVIKTSTPAREDHPEDSPTQELNQEYNITSSELVTLAHPRVLTHSGKPNLYAISVILGKQPCTITFSSNSVPKLKRYLCSYLEHPGQYADQKLNTILTAIYEAQPMIYLRTHYQLYKASNGKLYNNLHLMSKNGNR